MSCKSPWSMWVCVCGWLETRGIQLVGRVCFEFVVIGFGNSKVNIFSIKREGKISWLILIACAPPWQRGFRSVSMPWRIRSNGTQRDSSSSWSSIKVELFKINIANLLSAKWTLVAAFTTWWIYGWCWFWYPDKYATRLDRSKIFHALEVTVPIRPPPVSRISMSVSDFCNSSPLSNPTPISRISDWGSCHCCVADWPKLRLIRRYGDDPNDASPEVTEIVDGCGGSDGGKGGGTLSLIDVFKGVDGKDECEASAMRRIFCGEWYVLLVSVSTDRSNPEVNVFYDVCPLDM